MWNTMIYLFLYKFIKYNILNEWYRIMLKNNTTFYKLPFYAIEDYN